MRISRIMSLFATLVVGMLLAQAGWAAPSLSLGTASGTPGQVVNIPVSFTNDGTVVALQFDVQYTTVPLTAGMPTAGAALGTNGLASSEVTAGKLRVVITPSTGNALVGSGQMAVLPFTIQAGAAPGDLALTLSNVVMTDAAAVALSSFSANDGQVTVNASGPPADVCPTGCDYASIQSAIAAAANGATITVGPGTYNESIVISGNKTVTSASGPEGTVIDATGLNTYAVQIAGGSLVGLTITGGNAGDGGGVHITGAATVHNNIIQGNAASNNGGGIWFAQYTHVDIQNNVIQNNTAGNKGGGLYIINYATQTINANLIAGNSAALGGGIYTESYSDAVLTNLLIIGNSAQSYGGGIAMNSYSYPLLVNSTLSANTSGSGAGIFASGYAHGTVINSIIWGNNGSDIQAAWGGLGMTYSVTPSYSGTGMINANPQFTDAGNGDYHLGPGSPAIDTGSDASGSGVIGDFDGRARPQDGDGQGSGGTGDGSDFDIGAFEF